LADPSGCIGTPAVIEDTFWPTHPVCFFSALSLEKNTPSESASVMYLVKLYFYNRRNVIGDKNERTNDMAGGPTRTLARSGSERRPNRHGVNTLLCET